MTSRINFLYVAFVKLILEVFGTSGAIWGNIRGFNITKSWYTGNMEIWRDISSIIGIIFFIIFIFILKKLYQRINIEENSSEIIDF